MDPFLRFISVCLFLFLVFVVVSVRISDFVHDLLVLCAFCSQTPPLKKKYKLPIVRPSGLYVILIYYYIILLDYYIFILLYYYVILCLSYYFTVFLDIIIIIILLDHFILLYYYIIITYRPPWGGRSGVCIYISSF